MKGENVPNFKINTSTGTSSNVFQILQDLQLKLYNDQYSSCTMPTVMGKVYCTVPHPYEGQYPSSTVPIDAKNTMIMVQPMAQPTTSFRTTTPSTAMNGRMTTKQVNPVKVHQETSHDAVPEHCMHVHQPTVQVCQLGESLALRKVKHPLNGMTSVNRLPLTKQDILSQYSGCFEGIEHFPEDRTNFTSSQNTSLHNMHQGKFQSILKQHLRRRSSL